MGFRGRFGWRARERCGLEGSAFGGTGDGGDEAFGVVVLGIAKDLGDGSAFHDLTAVEDGQAVADVGDGQEIVGDEEHSRLMLLHEADEEGEDFALGDDVQSAGGLIGDQQGRTVQDRHHDEDALGLAHADLAGKAAEERLFGGQAGGFHEAEQATPLALPRLGRVGAPGFLELRAEPEGGIQRGGGALRDQADEPAADGAHGGIVAEHEVFAKQREAAAHLGAGVIEQLQESEGEGALAGAAFADEAGDFTRHDFEAGAPKHACPSGIVHREVRGEHGGGQTATCSTFQ